MTTTQNPRPAITDEQAALVGKRFTANDGTVRYYINDWAQILGFDIERSSSGALRYCHIPGVDDISNRKAEKLLCGKVWIQDGKLYAKVDWDDAGVIPIPMQDAVRAEIARRAA